LVLGFVEFFAIGKEEEDDLNYKWPSSPNGAIYL